MIESVAAHAARVARGEVEQLELAPPFDRPVPVSSPAMPPPWLQVQRDGAPYGKDFLTLKRVGDESCVPIWASDGKRWARDDEWEDHFSQCEECRLDI